MTVLIKDPSELANATWVFGGKTYYQIGPEYRYDREDVDESDQCFAMAIEEGEKPTEVGLYPCVELHLAAGPQGVLVIKNVEASTTHFDGVSGGFIDDEATLSD